MPYRILSAILIIASLLCACTTDQAYSHSPGSYNTHSNVTTSYPAYNNRSSDDDNGVAPLPNNGNQNFGRRW